MNSAADRAWLKFLLVAFQLYVVPAVRAPVHALAWLLALYQVPLPPCLETNDFLHPKRNAEPWQIKIPSEIMNFTYYIERIVLI